MASAREGYQHAQHLGGARLAVVRFAKPMIEGREPGSHTNWTPRSGPGSCIWPEGATANPVQRVHMTSPVHAHDALRRSNVRAWCRGSAQEAAKVGHGRRVIGEGEGIVVCNFLLADWSGGLVRKIQRWCHAG
jgi:hypothetical protein